MTLPLATTTITIKRVLADLSTTDPYEATAVPETIASGIRAHISSPSGSELVGGADSQESVTFRLDCDPTDLAHTDIVTDETTGQDYRVTWARSRSGLGLDHVEAGLLQVTGVMA